MSKIRKPIWLKILLWVFSTCLSFVAIGGAIVAFLYIRYQINVIDVYQQICTLNETIDRDRLLPNAYDEKDSEFALTIITIDDTGSYTINENVITSIGTNAQLRLSDSQVGGLLNHIIDNQKEIKIQIGQEINLKDYGFQILQVDFLNITETTADFNIVLKIDLTTVKESMTSFPLNWIARAIPNELYFSSTMQITMGEDFSYTTESLSLYINNLTEEQTDSIFETINTFVKIGNAKDFNKIIGDAFINVLIGKENSAGFAYDLYENNVITSFDFVNETFNSLETDYFVMYK